VVISSISPPFGRLSQARGQVTYVLLTRSPLYSGSCPPFLARLACVRHAASVRSEPGSNSPVELETPPFPRAEAQGSGSVRASWRHSPSRPARYTIALSKPLRSGPFPHSRKAWKRGATI